MGESLPPSHAAGEIGDDGIEFAIPVTEPFCDGTGRCVINLTSALPDLTTNMELNGPGADFLTIGSAVSARRGGENNAPDATSLNAGGSMKRTLVYLGMLCGVFVGCSSPIAPSGEQIEAALNAAVKKDNPETTAKLTDSK